MPKYQVKYTAYYMVEAPNEAEAVYRAIEVHEDLPDGDWDPVPLAPPKVIGLTCDNCAALDPAVSVEVDGEWELWCEDCAVQSGYLKEGE